MLARAGPCWEGGGGGWLLLSLPLRRAALMWRWSRGCACSSASRRLVGGALCDQGRASEQRSLGCAWVGLSADTWRFLGLRRRSGGGACRRAAVVVPPIGRWCWRCLRHGAAVVRGGVVVDSAGRPRGTPRVAGLSVFRSQAQRPLWAVAGETPSTPLTCPHWARQGVRVAFFLSCSVLSRCAAPHSHRHAQ